MLRFLDKLDKISNIKAAWVIVGLLALLLVSPSISGGFSLDDNIYRAKHRDGGFSITNQYHMHSYKSADHQLEKESGLLPWWASENLHIYFVKPLSAITHKLDFLLWPESATAQHIHNIIWFLATLLIVALMFRSFYGVTAVSLLAFLVFAIEDSHGYAVGWISNRNALVAMFFGVAALYALRMADLHGSRKSEFAAAALFLLSLLSSEAGAQAGAFIFAYIMVYDNRTMRRKLLRLLPFALMGFLWLIGNKLAGSLVTGSGLYIDPIADPIRYLMVLPERFVLIIASQFWYLPSQFAEAFPDARSFFVAVAGVLTFITAVTLSLLVSKRSVRFWLIAMLLSIFPVAATVPMDRNAWFISLSGAGLVAEFIEYVMARAGEPSRIRNLVGALTLSLIVFMHGLAPLVSLPINAIFPEKFNGAIHNVRTSLNEFSKRGNTVVALNSPSHFFFANNTVLQQKANNGKALGQKFYHLIPGFHRFIMQRTGERDLFLKLTQPFKPYFVDQVYRNPQVPFAAGQRFHLDDMQITIERVAEGWPFALTLTLKRPAGEYTWIEWNGVNFVDAQLPGIGESSHHATSLEQAMGAVMPHQIAAIVNDLINAVSSIGALPLRDPLAATTSRRIP